MKSTLYLSIIISFSAIAGAIPSIQDSTLRISLHRRSFNATSAQSAAGDQPSGAQRVASLIRYTHNKYASTLAAYERNTGSPHPLDTLSKFSSTGPIKRANDGTVALYNQDVQLWYGDLMIGTPSKLFSVDFDTGSADLIVPDKLCLETCDGHNPYDSSVSSTSHAKDIPFAVVYGSGNAAGLQYTDSVGVGGYEIANQGLGAAAEYSPEFSDATFSPDGISGLGFSSISALPATALIDNLRSSGQLPEPVFGFKLSSTSGESGLRIGAVDNTAFDPQSLVYTPVVEEGYWQVTLGSLSRSGYQVPASIDAAAIIDTGTTLIVAPEYIVSEYYGDAKNCDYGGVCTVPCDIINSTAPTLTFGGREFAVSAKTWNLGPYKPGSTECIAGLGVFNEISAVIVGDVFLQNVYSVFNFSDSPRVGFANLVG